MRSRDVHAERVTAQLTSAGLSATVRVVDPSLEDVFLDIAEKAARS
jgi:hypothetical protein